MYGNEFFQTPIINHVFKVAVIPYRDLVVILLTPFDIYRQFKIENLSIYMLSSTMVNPWLWWLTAVGLRCCSIYFFDLSLSLCFDLSICISLALTLLSCLCSYLIILLMLSRVRPFHFHFDLNVIRYYKWMLYQCIHTMHPEHARNQSDIA